MSRASYPVIIAVRAQGRPTWNSIVPARSRECRLISVNGPDSRMRLPLTDTQLPKELVYRYKYWRNNCWFIATGALASRRMVNCTPGFRLIALPKTWKVGFTPTLKMVSYVLRY